MHTTHLEPVVILREQSSEPNVALEVGQATTGSELVAGQLSASHRQHFANELAQQRPRRNPQRPRS